MGVKKGAKIAFLLLLFLAFIIALPSIVSTSYPMGLVCNYSSGGLSEAMIIGSPSNMFNAFTHMALGDILRGQNIIEGEVPPCGFQVTVWPLSQTGQKIENAPPFITPLTVTASNEEVFDHWRLKCCDIFGVCTVYDPEEKCVKFENTWTCDDGQTYASGQCDRQKVLGTSFLGSTSQDEFWVDPDYAWTHFNLLPDVAVGKLRFVEDPFVILNYSPPNYYPAFWNFHRNSADSSLVCEGQPDQGSVNSTTECVDYAITSKYANCRGDIQGPPGYDGTLSSFACCGDDDLVDPGFEATSSERNLYVWERTGNLCLGTWCARSSENAYAGSQSFQMRANNESAYIRQNATLNAGDYYLSFWIKQLNAKDLPRGVIAKISIETDPLHPVSMEVPQEYSDWRHYYLPFSVSSDDTLASFSFNVSELSGTLQGPIVWLDEVHIISRRPSGSQGLADYGRIYQEVPVTEGERPPNYLCYFNQTEWKWADYSSDAFTIYPVDGFDVLSNSYDWHACNANGQAQFVYGGEPYSELTPEYGTVTYVPPVTKPTIVTPGEIGGDVADYELDPSITTFIPDNEFETGLSIFNVQPAGAPEHCFNDVIDTADGESDLNCGDGCRPCYYGEHCNSDSDCISGQCREVEGEGEKICSGLVPEFNLNEYLAMRFVCSNQDEIAAYTECCGYDLKSCKNAGLVSRTRRAGNPLSSIFEFPVKNDNINYALLMGLRLEQRTDYNYPLKMTVADTKLYNWTNYDYLEFYIAYGIVPQNKYLRLLILDDIGDNSPAEYINDLASGELGQHVLFKGYIDDFITGQIQPGKWERVRIPIADRGIGLSDSAKMGTIQNSDHAKLISIFASQPEVPDNLIVNHEALPEKNFRNVIAVDRINLISDNPLGEKFCSVYPPGPGSMLDSFWVSDMDSTDEDISLQPIGKGVCENTPGYAWTGTECCGNDITQSTLPLNPAFVAESYADILGGCVKGYPLKNNSVMTLAYQNPQSGNNYGNASLIYYNSSFHTCNQNADVINSIKAELSFGGNPGRLPYSVSDSVLKNTASTGTCTNVGEYYCDFDRGWKNSSVLPGQIVNSSSSLPFDAATKACCPAGWCYYGNVSAPLSCVQSQADVFQYQEKAGNPYFFNSTINYSGAYGNDLSYRCVNGNWKFAELKWNPDNTDQGYCPESSMCYLSADDGCVNSSYYTGDDYCEEGNWSSRTKLVARQLMDIADQAINETGFIIQRATLYCDGFDEVLAQVDYANLELSEKTARQIVNCPELNLGMPCANNFCALSVIDSDGNEQIYIGTSTNIPLDTRTDYSLLRLFPEAVSGSAVSYNDYCDEAIIESAITGNYTGCANYEFVEQGPANLWIDNKTQTVIYSREGFNIADTITASDIFNQVLRHPLLSAYRWARKIIVGGADRTKGSDEFLAGLADFRKLYISISPGTDYFEVSRHKSIMGVVESPNLMTVSYKNIEENLCHGNETKALLKFGGIENPSSCNVFINDTTFLQNLYSTKTQYWKDLTTNTRIEGAYDPGAVSLQSNISVTGPTSLVHEGDAAVIAVSVNKAGTEDIIATSIDFGDGSGVSMKGVPPSGYWAVSHTYSSQGRFVIRAGLLGKDGGNFGTKTAAVTTGVLGSVQESYTMPENTAYNHSSLTVNFAPSFMPDWQMSITQQDGWLNCLLNNYVLACTPDINVNVETNGTGNVEIELSLTGTSITSTLEIEITVNPVNTPPQFTTSFEEIESPEGQAPGSGGILVSNLPGFVTDADGNPSDLSFAIKGVQANDRDLITAFGCAVSGQDIVCSRDDPSNDYFGLLNITVTAYDFQGLSDNQSLVVNITNVNDAPYFDSFQWYKELAIRGNWQSLFGNFIRDIDNPVSDISMRCDRVADEIEIRCAWSGALASLCSCADADGYDPNKDPPYTEQELSLFEDYTCVVDKACTDLETINHMLNITDFGTGLLFIENAAAGRLDNCTDTYVCNASDNDANAPLNTSTETLTVVVKENPNNPPQISFVPGHIDYVNEGGEPMELNVLANDPDTAGGYEYDNFNWNSGNSFGPAGAVGFTQNNHSGTAKFWWNTSLFTPPAQQFTEEQLDNNIGYSIAFSVVDKRGLSDTNNFDFLFNRKPAIEVTEGAYVDNITDYAGNYVPVKRSYTFINGSPAFTFKASDFDTLLSCTASFGDGTDETSYAECGDYSSPFSFQTAVVHPYDISSLTNTNYGIRFKDGAFSYLGAPVSSISGITGDVLTIINYDGADEEDTRTFTVTDSEGAPVQSCILHIGESCSVNFGVNIGDVLTVTEQSTGEQVGISTGENKTYLVSFNAMDFFGARTTRYILLDYSDYENPEALINNLDVNYNPDTMNANAVLDWSVSDNNNIAYCGYFLDHSMAEYDLPVLYNLGSPDFAISYQSGCNGQQSFTQSGLQLLNINEGSHIITVFAVDDVGRKGYESMIFKVDKTAPSVSIVGGSETLIPSSTPGKQLYSVSIQLSDSGTGLASAEAEIKDDVGTNYYSNSWDFEDFPLTQVVDVTDAELDEGKMYTLSVTASDSVGNEETSDYEIDLTAPAS